MVLVPMKRRVAESPEGVHTLLVHEPVSGVELGFPTRTENVGGRMRLVPSILMLEMV